MYSPKMSGGTHFDSIESFLRNRGALVQVTQDHKNEIDSEVIDVVNDSKLVSSAKKYLEVMKPIVVALDRVQRNDTTIAVAVEVWERLARELQHVSGCLLSLQEAYGYGSWSCALPSKYTGSPFPTQAPD